MILGGLWFTYRGIGIANLLDLLPIPATDWFAGLLLLSYAGLLGLSLVLAQAIQTAFLLSRFSSMARPLLAAWITAMLIWAGVRAVPLVANWFRWLPPISITNVASVGDGFIFVTDAFHSGPLAAILLYTVALLLISGYALNAIAKRDDDELAGEPGNKPTDLLAVELVPESANDPAAERAHEPTRVRGATGRYGRRPARLPNLRERFLIVILTASALFLYDAIGNGSIAVGDFTASLARPVVTRGEDVGFRIDSPFLSRSGALQAPAQNAKRLAITGIGDIEVVGTDGETIDVQYRIRTYAESAIAAEAIHSRTDVTLTSQGDTLHLNTVLPPDADEHSVRVEYKIGVPGGIPVSIDTRKSFVRLDRIDADVRLSLDDSSFSVSQTTGDVTLQGAEITGVIVDSRGHASLEVKEGTLEIHGHRGALEIHSDGIALQLSGVDGDVAADVRRGVASFRSIAGDLEVSAHMARLEIVEVKGAVSVTGKSSPTSLAGPIGRAEVVSELGNVRVDAATDAVSTIRTINARRIVR